MGLLNRGSKTPLGFQMHTASLQASITEIPKQCMQIPREQLQKSGRGKKKNKKAPRNEQIKRSCPAANLSLLIFPISHWGGGLLPGSEAATAPARAARSRGWGEVGTYL